jgi:serine/threonine-protein kinase HipA
MHAGLPVPKLALSENRRLLVAQRFDLTEEDIYLGVEDFCVLNGMRSAGRYDSSYEQIATRIRDFVSPQQQLPALEQFFLTLALCCAIENGDAHLKNFAVLYENPQSTVRLAPAYDLVCTTLYMPRDTLALTLGDSKAFPQAKELISFAARHCELSPAKADALVQKAIGGVRRACSDIRRYVRRNGDFAKAGERMIERFGQGVKRLRS